MYYYLEHNKQLKHNAIIYLFFFKGPLSSACTIILEAATIIFQIAIKTVLKYLEYKHNSEHKHLSDSTAPVNKAASINNKYTVSLGSALFFAIVMIFSISSQNSTREKKLYFFSPVGITLGCMCFPLLIILGNPKLKKEFVRILERPLIKYLKCSSTNMINPTV